jgi:hypothetical protein
MSYKRKMRRMKGADHSARPMSLAEYNDELLKRRSSVKGYFIISAPFLIISILMVFI